MITQRQLSFFTILILAGMFISNCDNTKNESSTSNTTNSIEMKAPDCKQIPKKLTIHNDTRIDNYYWLNERENPEVIDYLNRENKYTEQKLKHTESLQKELFEEMKGRIKEEVQSVPYFYNGYYYISRYEKGKEYIIKSRKKSTLEAEEEILLDCNKLAEGTSYFALGGNEISTNNELIAYSTDTVSRRLYNIHFKNLKTEEVYPETIPNTTGSFTWANDNKSLFYVKQDLETLRSYQIMKHILGTPVEEDVIIYEEKDEEFDVYVYKTKSEKFIVISSTSTLTSEYQLINANTPNDKPTLFAEREHALEYEINHKGNQFYIQTNKDKATNFKVMVCDDNNTAVKNWKEFIPHNKDILIEYLELFSDYLVITERKDGLNQLRVLNFNTNESYYIPFNDEAYSASTSVNIEFDTKKLRYDYSSLTTPNSEYEFDLETKEQVLLKQQEIIGGHNPEDYTSKRITATSRDGVKIPISLVYKKTTKLDENTPLLQYAYGSYGHNIDPYFSSARLSLLNRGFVYAIAHIRGSETLGREWYENGKFLKKKNTFYDFIDCSKFLISEGYTSTKNLFASGGSAGGLLMGAIMNYNPELYNGILAAVPFVDVVTTMLDESIPLTTGEYEEWGNPNDKIYYEYMKSYSPYDNVIEQVYPNVLITTGLHDSQVQYWEPAKWTAKLRDLNTSDNLILLKTNMEAGHGGASGRFDSLKEVAEEYAFIISLIKS